jgi:DNA-binding MarR family transcriptional regulator
MQQLPETIKSSIRSPIRSPIVEECARELLDSMPPVMWFIRRQMRAHRGGMSLAQFRSLARVNRNPSASLSNVAEHLGASLPTTSRIVTGLVEKGFLVRHNCRWDRRQVSLDLTPRGREVLQTARKAAQQHMETELGNLPATDLGALIKATKILKGIFGPANTPAPVVAANGNPSGGRSRKSANLMTGPI